MGVVRIYSRIHCLLGRVPLDSLTLANVADLQLMSNQNQSHADVILVQPNHPILIHLIFISKGLILSEKWLKVILYPDSEVDWPFDSVWRKSLRASWAGHSRISFRPRSRSNGSTAATQSISCSTLTSVKPPKYIHFKGGSNPSHFIFWN